MEKINSTFYKPKPVDELTFADNYMFTWILEHDKEICKGIIERLLKIKVRDISYPIIEAVISPYYESKGVRLDVYVEDEDAVYDIEIQTYDMEDLPQRTRYYQSLLDTDLIMKGEKYYDLKKSYIVFICLDDPKGEGLPLYTFRNRCDEKPDVVLGDGTVKMYANAAAYEDEKDVEIRGFLEYIKKHRASTDFTRRIEGLVDDVKKLNEFRSGYGRMNIHDVDIMRMAKKEKALETARKMLAKGISVDIIVECTGLPLSEVTALQAEIVEYQVITAE